jgi:PGF-CTERM protein
MAHMDSNDNGEYEFPDADDPFTDAAGDIVLDTANATVSTTSTVSFGAQSTGGTRVVVDEAYLPDGGFVVFHDEQLTEGDAVGSVRGASDYLAPGLHRNVVVDLDRPLDAGTTEQLTAMTHRDTNGNMAYEFPDADGPYTADGGAVVDGANVTVSASVAYDTTESDGNTVTIDSVDLSEGGFVVVHDAALFAGEVEGSVLGSSEYLEAGVHEDVTVTLATPATESQVLVPMAHRDTNGNEAYDFPAADGPYVYDGGAVVATGRTIVRSQVSLNAQETMGETVTVASVTLSDGGFVTIHDSTLLDGDALGSVRGTSTYLGPGTHTDVEVTLDEPLEEDDTLVAMPHRDTDGNEAYTFVESEGSADGPYTAAGSVVVASADVTYTGEMSGDDMDSGETEMTDDEMGDDDMDSEETEMTDEAMEGDTESAGDSTSESTPGFGVVLAVLAVLAAAFLATRGND